MAPLRTAGFGRAAGWLVFVAGLPAAWWTGPTLAQDVPSSLDPFAVLGGLGAPAVPQDQGQAPGADGAPAATASAPEDDGVFEGAVAVNEYDLVDLHVLDERLSTILQLLSIEGRRNIIASQNVSATVTADLYGVTFEEALDAILHVNGYAWARRGDFVYVYTAQELAALEQADRRKISGVITLDYLNPTDAAAFVAPLLSETGSITTPGQSAEFLIPDSAPTGKDDYASDAIIVVHDYEENFQEIQALIRRIDTRPAQVLVEATILQTELDEANAFGVDFSLIGDLNFSDFISPLDAVDSLLGGRGSALIAGEETATAVPDDGEARAITSTVGNTTGRGGLKIGIVDEDVSIFMRVLDEVTDLSVVSNPKVLTLNRQAARVLVGTRVGYLNTTTTETATTQTVEFLDTGTQLHIRPFVTSDGLIRMELKPQVSTFAPRETTIATGQTVTIPDENTTELVTNVLLRDGQTVVLGGLFTETVSASRRQVPVLGDIPIIGAAFRGHDDTTTRAEIIFLVTPSIVNDQVLTLEGERATEYVERARTGAREGLLPWSRDRQVSQLLIEADRLAKEGDARKALLKVQRALALQPHSPDAIALRERLAGERDLWPSRSMLDDILGDDRRPYTDLQTEQAGDEPDQTDSD